MLPRLRLPFHLLVVCALSACVTNVPPKTEAEVLVGKAQWTVEAFKNRADDIGQLFRTNLKEARGVLIMPEVIKGAFVIGAEGGPGVLLARDAAGNWGYPAFYNVGAGSFGLQIGGQSAQVILVLRSQGAVESVVFHQGKLGADAQLTVGHVGAGMQASTTTNVGADIVGFSRAAGIFGGVSLEGGMISRRDDLNQAFYGPGATPQAIVLQHRFSNPQADGLRAALRVE